MWKSGLIIHYWRECKTLQALWKAVWYVLINLSMQLAKRYIWSQYFPYICTWTNDSLKKNLIKNISHMLSSSLFLLRQKNQAWDNLENPGSWLPYLVNWLANTYIMVCILLLYQPINTKHNSTHWSIWTVNDVQCEGRFPFSLHLLLSPLSEVW